MNAKPSIARLIVLFALCYLPASYVLIFAVMAYTVATAGSHIAGADLFGLLAAPLSLLGLLLIGTGNWSNGFTNQNLVWWGWSALVLVWAVCFIAALRIFRRFLQTPTPLQ